VSGTSVPEAMNFVEKGALLGERGRGCDE